jgi:hypothetical protein
MTFLRIGFVLVIAVAAVIVANIVLLGIASGSQEPVGHLRPVPAASPATPTATVTMPAQPVRAPTAPHGDGTGESEDD